MKTQTHMKTLFLVIITALLLASCSAPSHGYNYKAHAARNHKAGKQALKVNAGKSLTAYKCTHKKHK